MQSAKSWGLDAIPQISSGDKSHVPYDVNSNIMRPSKGFKVSETSGGIMKVYSLVLLSLFAAGASSSAGGETKEIKIKRALSAAPANVAVRARVVDMDEKGKMTVLRDGDNGFTCVAGHMGVVGDSPACMDTAGLQWMLDWISHKPKPTNTQPGIIYQLAGASDWSAKDPWATSGTKHKWPPGWVIAWPFDPRTTGLSSEPNNKGIWIMWAGTPYAHLMINQCP
jgi:hypothetical protein